MKEPKQGVEGGPMYNVRLSRIVIMNPSVQGIYANKERKELIQILRVPAAKVRTGAETQ
jgi:hypothetical protein